jgi:hypothetical protein
VAANVPRRRVSSNDAFEVSALRRRYLGKQAGKIDGRESPSGHERACFRALQQVPDLIRAKSRVDVNGNGTQPRARENQCEIIDAVWQPQCDPVAEADAAPAERAPSSDQSSATRPSRAAGA